MKKVNYVSYKKQQGWTFWSMLFVMSVLGFFGYVGMQLVPVYMANESVVNSMEVALEDKDLRTMTRSKLLRDMQAQLYLDANHNILDYKNDVKVKRSRTEFIVETNYSREIPLFFNLSLKADFNNKVARDLK